MNLSQILKLVNERPDLVQAATENLTPEQLLALAKLQSNLGSSGAGQINPDDIMSMLGGSGKNVDQQADVFGAPLPKVGPDVEPSLQAKEILSNVEADDVKPNWKQSGGKALQKAITWLTTNPIGEEVLEGTLGGLMAGGTLLSTDQSAERTGLQTALAIAGGIGVGMAGRRIGASLGKTIHPDALANQSGPIAMLSRLGGSETTMGGMQQQAKVATRDIKDTILNNELYSLRSDAKYDPVAFRSQYGFGQKEIDNYEKVREVLGKRGTDRIDNSMKKGATILEKISNDLGATGEAQQASELLGKASNVVRDISNQDDITQITGEQVGKALGRLIGDEAGIIGGLAIGGYAANSLGLKSKKDKQIEKLEELLKKNNIEFKN